MNDRNNGTIIGLLTHSTDQCTSVNDSAAGLRLMKDVTN